MGPGVDVGVGAGVEVGGSDGRVGAVSVLEHWTSTNVTSSNIPGSVDFAGRPKVSKMPVIGIGDLTNTACMS